jgi:hypothetical protein
MVESTTPLVAMPQRISSAGRSPIAASMARRKDAA